MLTGLNSETDAEEEVEEVKGINQQVEKVEEEVVEEVK